MLNKGNVDNNYPYAVLGNYNDFEGSNNFLLRIRYGARSGYFEFTCNITVDRYNTDYEDLVKNNKAKYCILLHSPQTFLRKYYSSSEKVVQFSIDQKHLRGKLYLTAFIIANEEITNFSPIGQNKSFFGDSGFDIPIGGLLAISNTINTYIDPTFKKQNKEDAKHIIKFVKSKNVKSTFEVRDWGADQLIVEMPEKLYETWSNAINDHMKYMHHCAIYLPILTDAITKIEFDSEDDSYNSLNDLKWYYVISNLINKAEFPDNMDPFVKAQKLMNGPFKPFVKELDYFMENLYEDED